eukprot:tig00000955_g5798.t1
MAVPLILEEGGKLSLGEGAKLLSGIDADEVTTICIVGPYRTGKSYLMSLLAGNEGAFKVGGSVDAVTRGIWVYSGGVRTNPANGKRQAVLFMDTEGLRNSASTPETDARLFSLTMMLASYLMVNTVGSLDDQSIQDVAFITQLTNFLHVKSHGAADDETGEGLADFAPSLLWLVRDFALQLADAQGNPLSAAEYLEGALAEKPGFAEETLAKNRVTYAIKSIFKDRDCETLIRPAGEENVLQKLFSLKKEIRKEFLDAVERLKIKVLSRAKPKTMGSFPVTPKTLVRLAEEFIAAVNESRIPTIADSWTAVQSIQNKNALQAAADEFASELEKAIAGKLPLETSDLMNLHKLAKKQAVALFDSKAVGDSSQHRKELKFKIADAFQKVNSENERASLGLCKALLAELYGDLEARIASVSGGRSVTTLEEYEEAWANLRKVYVEKARGPASLAVLSEFMEQKVVPAMKVFILQSKTRAELDKSELSTRALKAEKGEKQTKLDTVQAMAALQEQVDAARREAARAAGEKKVLEESSAAVNAQLAAAQSELVKVHNLFADMEKRFSEQLGTLNSRVISVEASKNSLALELEAKTMECGRLAGRVATLEQEQQKTLQERDVLFESVRGLGADPEGVLRTGPVTPRTPKTRPLTAQSSASKSAAKSASKLERGDLDSPARFRDEIAVRDRELATLKKDVIALQKQILLKDKALVRVTDDLAKAKEDAEALAAKARSAESEARVHVGDKKQLQTEIHRREVVLESTCKEVSKLSELHQLREELRALASKTENEAAYKSAEVEAAKREVRTMAKVVSDRERDLARCQGLIDELQAKVKALEINPAASVASLGASGALSTLKAPASPAREAAKA